MLPLPLLLNRILKLYKLRFKSYVEKGKVDVQCLNPGPRAGTAEQRALRRDDTKVTAYLMGLVAPIEASRIGSDVCTDSSLCNGSN